jgi:serine/threonine-protein kinase HipA
MGVLRLEPYSKRLKFSYDPSWKDDADSFPISLSMPLVVSDHPHEAIEAYIWGLLPDNDAVLQQWGTKFQVSPSSPFHLLCHLGEDCAGAVQFVSPEREHLWAGESSTGHVEWIDEGQLEERMVLLRRNHGATRIASDVGQFSLAGAQPKTAMIFDAASDSWGVPSGNIPSTHILKPATGAFIGLAENEHFCLSLAEELGLSAVRSWVKQFQDGPVVIVERYDRIITPERIVRVHQEDMCQALGYRPHNKYQSQGGPSAGEIVKLLRRHSSTPEEDVKSFTSSLVLNWLIFGTDAHSKNFSILFSGGAQLQLAPLYDVSSALPYPTSVDLRRAGMAMKIGGAYKMRDISLRSWEKFATENALDWTWLRDRITDMTRNIPDASLRVAARMREDGIEHEVIDKLPALLAERMQDCAQKPSWQV